MSYIYETSLEPRIRQLVNAIIDVRTLLIFCIALMPLSADAASMRASSPNNIRMEVFTTIQQAINNANPGDTISVPTGTYYERVIVNKTISLIGEGSTTTIIDGSGAGTVVTITADNVSVRGFTIRNSGYGWTKNGIYVQADNCEISDNRLVNNCHCIRLNCSRGSFILGNVLDDNYYGIRMLQAEDCVAIGNKVTNCVIGALLLEIASNCTLSRNVATNSSQGLRMYSPCTYNTVSANTIANNTYDGLIDNSMNGNSTFYKNMIHHNNFNNTRPFILKGSGNVWDDGYPSGGNYWSRYCGTDLYSGEHQNETGSDGIGDIPYVMDYDNADHYPLMQPCIASPVQNLDTNIEYASIQEAIDAPETLGGHRLHVEPGFYHENIRVHKGVNITGKDRLTTIIDGNGATALTVEADSVKISSLTLRNGGFGFPPESFCGIFVNRHHGFTMVNCKVTNSRTGVYLYYSTSSLLERNLVCDNHESGIWLWFSGNNTLIDNNIRSNKYNFGTFGGTFSHFNNSVGMSNRVNGKPILYRTNVKDETIEGNGIGVIYIINGAHVTLRNIHSSENGHGLFCFNITNSTVKNVTADRNNYGIRLQNSSNVTITNCLCTNDWVGVSLETSTTNIIQETVMEKCEKAISLYEADGNTFGDNVLASGVYGIRAFSSSFNTFVHNSLLNNTVQVDLISSYENVWNDGCEGNYWSGYKGADLDGDGVGDTELPCETVDAFPLMCPYFKGDVNHDLRVNLLDLTRVTAAYMTTPADTRWNPHADVAYPHDIVDLQDIITVVGRYGDTWRQP